MAPVHQNLGESLILIGFPFSCVSAIDIPRRQGSVSCCAFFPLWSLTHPPAFLLHLLQKNAIPGEKQTLNASRIETKKVHRPSPLLLSYRNSTPGASQQLLYRNSGTTACFFKVNFVACFEVSRGGSSNDCQLSVW